MQGVSEALRWVLSRNVPARVRTAAATAAVALATVTVVYIVWPGSEPDTVADAAVFDRPLFTPVTLSPPAPSPAVRPSERSAMPPVSFDDQGSVIRAVQAALKRAGCYKGPVNGVWTTATRKAMAEFTERVNAQLPVDEADPVLLVLLETHGDTTCAGGAPARPDERRAGTRKAEIAGIEQRRPVETHAAARPPVVAEEAEAQRREALAPEPDRTVPDRASPTPPPMETASVDVPAAAVDDGMAVLPPAVAPREQINKRERRRATRKYRKKPSLSRSFRQIQRTFNKLF